MENRFVVFEGIDGCGKTRAMEAFVSFLKEAHDKVEKKFSYLPLREPGGTSFGENVRNLIFSNESLSPDTKILLMEAARLESLEHISSVYKRFPESWIISDRHADSTWAYQGHGEGGSLELIEDLDFHRPGPYPLVTVYLDVSVAIAMERTSKRPSDMKNYLDNQDVTFYQRVVDGYMERINYVPEMYYVVNSNGSIEETDAQLKVLAQNLAVFGVPPTQDYIFGE